MSPETTLAHEFVDFIPDELKEGTLYVSMRFATVAHKCCCGCRKEVVTPLSPTDWKLIFDGKTISLDPSIGNWSFDCKSHYWILGSRVKWAPRWSQEQIATGRLRDYWAKKKKYFNGADVPSDQVVPDKPRRLEGSEAERNFWGKLLRRWWSQ